MAHARGVSGVPEGHVLTVRPGVQVRSSRQELPGGQRTGHCMLRLTQGKKGWGKRVNRKSKSIAKRLGNFSLAGG